MKKVSLADFIFSNEEICDYIEKKLNDYLIRINDYDFKELNIFDIHIRLKNEKYHMLQNGNILFFLDTQLNYVLTDKNGNFDEFINEKCVFECSCDINIDGVKIINLYFSQEMPTRVENVFLNLTSALIPIIKKEDYEDVVDQLLSINYKGKYPVDIVELIESNGSEILNYPIWTFSNLYAQTFFDYYEFRNNITKRVPPLSVVYDLVLDKEENAKQKKAALAHEAIHLLLHKKAMYLRKCFNNSIITINKYFNDNIDLDIADDNFWMEKHAKDLSPILIMPKYLFLLKLDEYRELYKMKNIIFSKTEFIKYAIYKLSIFFNVSRESAKIRLIQLGYEEAKGVLEYVDSRYIESYSFSSGALNSNQTFTIGISDLLSLLEKNQDIREKYNSKDFLYIDGHLCKNSKKYLKFDGDNSIILTDYARRHLDECCIKFSYVRTEEEYLNDNYLFLNKKVHKAATIKPFDIEIPIFLNENNDKITDYISTNIKIEYAVVQYDFCKSLKNILEILDIPKIRISEALEVDKSYISRVLNGTQKMSKIGVIKMCKFLKLQSKVTYQLLEFNGTPVNSSSNEDKILRVLLDNGEFNSLHKTNDALKRYKNYF